MTSPPIGLGAHDGIACRREYDAGQRRLGARAGEAGCNGQNLRLSPLRTSWGRPLAKRDLGLCRRARPERLSEGPLHAPRGATNASYDHRSGSVCSRPCDPPTPSRMPRASRAARAARWGRRCSGGGHRPAARAPWPRCQARPWLAAPRSPAADASQPACPATAASRPVHPAAVAAARSAVARALSAGQPRRTAPWCPAPSERRSPGRRS